MFNEHKISNACNKRIAAIAGEPEEEEEQKVEREEAGNLITTNRKSCTMDEQLKSNILYYK